jgi:hypothetical protein
MAVICPIHDIAACKSNFVSQSNNRAPRRPKHRRPQNRAGNLVRAGSVAGEAVPVQLMYSVLQTTFAFGHEPPLRAGAEFTLASDSKRPMQTSGVPIRHL